MLYPLFIRLFFICNKAILFLSSLYYYDIWRRPLFIVRKKHIDILCVYGSQHRDAIAYIRKKLNKKVVLCEIKNCSNMKIAERVYTLCAKYTPANLFIFFEDINIVDEFLPDGKILSIYYEEISENTASKTKDINYVRHCLVLFMKFLYMFATIKMLCQNNNISLFWSLPHKIIDTLNKNNIQHFFKDNNYTRYISTEHDTQVDTAQKFIQQYNKHEQGI